MEAYDPGIKFWDVINRQKQILDEGKKRKGQRPQDRKSREYAKVMFMIACMNAAPSNSGYVFHTSFTPQAYSPCTMPMADLKQTAIQDLLLETHHRGFYLLLRCITPPSRKTAIMVLTEDKNDDVAMLQIFQQEDEKIRPATDIANTGVMLLIKEPYYKVFENGEYGLRVDHLSDIIQLKSNDARIPLGWQLPAIELEQSAESLKLKGNLAMQEGRFWDAITIYSDALAQPLVSNEADILERNRSLAFLRTKQFDAALSDTGFPNFDKDSSEKAMFRAGEALYYLERFDECCQVLENLSRLYPLNSRFQAAYTSAQSRLREQKTGEYNFALLQAKAKNTQPPQLEHATYIGPVEVRLAGSKGRGLFVTKSVKAGDLLLCEKAFAYCFAPGEPGKKKGRGPVINILKSSEIKSPIIGTQVDLIKTVVQKVYHNPSLSSTVTDLYHGDYKGLDTTAVDGMPTVDTFLMEQITCLNMFTCPASSLKFHSDNYRHRRMLNEAFRSSGLWIQASYINHSCTNNACRSFIGDMIIVRATCDMKGGTEILFAYDTVFEKHPELLRKKFENWGFECKCAICSNYRSTSPAVLAKRDELRKKLEMIYAMRSLGDDEMQKIERLLDELNQTYSEPADKAPRLLVWDMQLLLAHIYSDEGHMKKCIVATRKGLMSLGFVLTGTDSPYTPFAITQWGMTMDPLVEVFLTLQNAFMKTNSPEKAIRAGEYAKTAYKMVVGEDASFDSVWFA